MGRRDSRRPLLQGGLSLFILSIIAFSLNATGATQPRQGEVLTGKVVGVSDGDTITVLGPGNREYRIRLNGIDAPEKSQEFGNAARENLSRLVFGREVRVVWQKEDRYNRLLGRVYVSGTDVNLAQLKSGLAWYYRAYANDVAAGDRSIFDRAEEEARRGRRGLWSTASPTAPWDFRAAARGGETLTRTGAPQPVSASSPGSGAVRGNRNSGIYHLPECPDYEKIGYRNRVSFRTEEEARQNGFRKARNCP